MKIYQKDRGLLLEALSHLPITLDSEEHFSDLKKRLKEHFLQLEFVSLEDKDIQLTK